MKQNKTSQWAGFSASFFTLATCVLFLAFAESGARNPSWIHVLTGWCGIFAVCSAVVCLVSAFFAFLSRWKKSAVKVELESEKNSNSDSMRTND
jgi:hypothetical protein